MKMQKTIFAALAIATMASCNKESDNTQMTQTNDVATFTSVVTRVSGAEWEATDKVGIIVTNSYGTAVADNATYKYNALYNVTPDPSDAKTGDFVAATDADKFYYPVDGSYIQFYAYYPYSTAVVSNVECYPIDVATQSTPKLIDFMEASTTSGYNKTSGDVALAFKRRMTKLTFTVSAGTDVDLSELTAISLEGFYTYAVYSLATNSFGTSTFADVKSITPYTESTANTYSAILIPTHESNETEITLHSTPKVKFTVDGEAFYWDLAGVKLKAGDNNIYTVEISRAGVTTKGTIQEWNPIANQTVSAE